MFTHSSRVAAIVIAKKKDGEFCVRCHRYGTLRRDGGLSLSQSESAHARESSLKQSGLNRSREFRATFTEHGVVLNVCVTDDVRVHNSGEIVICAGDETSLLE